MTKALDEILDVAIVGAGVSGLYAAWRLSSDNANNDPRIGVFESSSRLGGRLWSIDVKQEHAIPAELGGMFFSDAQPIVYNLCTEVLELNTQSISPRPDFAYLRGKRFRISDFPKPDVVPYQLTKEEQGKPYHQLIFLALRKILPEIDNHWPLSKDGTIDETIRYLRSVEFEGRRLYHWGFWNLLSKVLSNEAYLCLRDVVSSFALFSNWNGYDACLSMLGDLTGNWHNLPDGYQRLPEQLAQEAERHGTKIHLNSPVGSIADGDTEDTFQLTIHAGGEQRVVMARSVILAMPKFAIETLDPASSVFANGELRENLRAVESVPACKIFLTFDDPWWRRVPDGPGQIAEGTFAASHTDLPMRQCYYLGTDTETGNGLMLASYSDAQSVPFWSTLMTNTGRRSGLEARIPEAARAEIRRQLSEMHGVDVPAPKEGIFVDWSAPPYGGGWHAWLPGWKSYDVMAALRRPDPKRKFSVCGESVCAFQGWVEGALTSAEVLLQEQYHLQHPEWLYSTDSLAPYTTGQ